MPDTQADAREILDAVDDLQSHINELLQRHKRDAIKQALELINADGASQ